MKKALLVVLSVSVGAFFLWSSQKFAQAPVPCAEPITYNIGTFDRKFGLSEKDFLTALSQAEAMWEKPMGKELFTYDPEQADLTVNLIYDYRQEVTTTLSSLGEVVEQNESTYKALQVRYVELKAKYDSAKKIYDARVASFEQSKEAYQAQVEAWNNSSRTSKAQFNELENSRKALQAEADALKTLETQFNESVKEINTLVSQLNSLGHTLNLDVKNYNTIGASRGESFTGGVYDSVDGEQSINIYEFSNHDKLVRILAHELGHALGLEHVDDPEAIMYYLNEGHTLTLTKADLAALNALCYTKGITSPEQSRGEN